MKLLLTAIALTIASPALAQAPAPADAHAGHNQTAPAKAQTSDPHAGHDMKAMGMMSPEAMKAHCAKIKAEGKKMDGCPMMKGSAKTADPHAGHDMSSK